MKIRKYSPLVITFIVIGLSWGVYERANYNVATVVDGDTIKIGTERIRLFGIDAPEKKQTCERGEAETLEKWSCGVLAKDYLSKLVGKDKVLCFMIDKDRYRRKVSICLNKQYKDISKEMVKAGYALAYIKYSKWYIKEEAEAKQNKKGIWGGKFTKPEDYRRKKHEKGQKTGNVVMCTPKNNLAKILSAPDPKMVAEGWKESEIGLSWTFIAEETLRGNNNKYRYGVLVNPRGGAMPDKYYILAKEWYCEKPW